jgi:hypothetical protein
MEDQTNADGVSSGPESVVVSGLELSSNLDNTVVHGLRVSHTTPHEPLSAPSFRRRSKHASYTHPRSIIS